jgi:hypothetical protein
MVQDGNIIARLFKSKNKKDISLLINSMHLELSAFYFYFFLFNTEFYLFLFGQQKIVQPNMSLNNNLNNIHEIIKKKRLIRSFNGLFSYIIELQQQTDLFKLIKSNFPIGFWENTRRIIKRRQKDELKLFLVKLLTDKNAYVKTYGLTNKNFADENQHLILENQRLTLEIEALQRLISETKI